VFVAKEKKNSKDKYEWLLTILKPSICVVHVLQEPLKPMTGIYHCATPVRKARIIGKQIQEKQAALYAHLGNMVLLYFHVY
jgi:hypothetical protein